jgi:predicted dehydrogenase
MQALGLGSPSRNDKPVIFMKIIALVVLALSLAGGASQGAESKPSEPFRVGIVGLVHDHAQGFIADLLSRTDVELAGIAEANPVLIARYTERYKLPSTLFHPTLEEMLDATHVRAVAVCSSTFDHAKIVEACAARGVHVMVEKPLAVNVTHARAISEAAAKGRIHVIVNFETTWYPSTQSAGIRVNERHEIGEIRKIVVHDGHEGPKEIGASAEFLAWLTDPVLNGGGALTDFGCYGANLITWLMNNQRPTSVTAVMQTLKPAVYPKVDDEATIVLTYSTAQGIIQASWNWPFGRKDMEIYGATGSLLAPEQNLLRIRTAGKPLRDERLPALVGASGNPLSYFAAVVRGELTPTGLSALDNNLIVTEILDAARESARTGQRVNLR